jgi:hypothetical protein
METDVGLAGQIGFREPSLVHRLGLDLRVALHFLQDGQKSLPPIDRCCRLSLPFSRLARAYLADASPWEPGVATAGGADVSPILRITINVVAG